MGSVMLWMKTNKLKFNSGKIEMLLLLFGCSLSPSGKMEVLFVCLDKWCSIYSGLAALPLNHQVTICRVLLECTETESSGICDKEAYFTSLVY